MDRHPLPAVPRRTARGCDGLPHISTVRCKASNKTWSESYLRFLTWIKHAMAPISHIAPQVEWTSGRSAPQIRRSRCEGCQIVSSFARLATRYGKGLVLQQTGRRSRCRSVAGPVAGRFCHCHRLKNCGLTMIIKRQGARGSASVDFDLSQGRCGLYTVRKDLLNTR